MKLQDKIQDSNDYITAIYGKHLQFFLVSFKLFQAILMYVYVVNCNQIFTCDEPS